MSNVFWVLNEALIERFITRITVTQMGEEDKKGNENAKDELPGAAIRGGTSLWLQRQHADVPLFVCYMLQHNSVSGADEGGGGGGGGSENIPSLKSTFR